MGPKLAFAASALSLTLACSESKLPATQVEATTNTPKSAETAVPAEPAAPAEPAKPAKPEKSRPPEGIATMLGNISAEKKNSSSNTGSGRIARQYEVEGTWKGTPINGLGRGIVVDPTTAIVVNSFWQASDSSCPDMGEFFVNSLVAESK
ncbi:MAG: hypothetical protein GY811_27125 [Myxococcales bacterium]|nr:hypothetical protein [Myxococcales bacterium]